SEFFGRIEKHNDLQKTGPRRAPSKIPFEIPFEVQGRNAQNPHCARRQYSVRRRASSGDPPGRVGGARGARGEGFGPFPLPSDPGLARSHRSALHKRGGGDRNPTTTLCSIGTF